MFCDCGIAGVPLIKFVSSSHLVLSKLLRARFHHLKDNPGKHLNPYPPFVQTLFNRFEITEQERNHVNLRNLLDPNLTALAVLIQRFSKAKYEPAIHMYKKLLQW